MANHKVSINTKRGNRADWFTWTCTCGARSSSRFAVARKAGTDARNNGHR